MGLSELLTKEQERVLVLLLDEKKETAYSCSTTMRTIYALLRRDLIKRTNYGEMVWSGWENTGMKFKLTESGRVLAEKLKEQRQEVV